MRIGIGSGRELAAGVRSRGSRVAVAGGALVLLILVMLLVPTVSTSGPRSSGGLGVGQVTVTAGVTPPETPGSNGTTVGGTQCRPGIRQVTWSVYAPTCVPEYHGNNGGAASPGVTRTTITIGFRYAASSLLQSIYSLYPKDVIGGSKETLSTLQAYIKLFNKDFELYGRKVVLSPFGGHGNFVSELTGTGQDQAQADAIEEKSLGAFADDSLSDTSPLFANDLVEQKVVSVTLWPPNRGWFASQAPYAYAVGPDCDKREAAVAAFAADELQNRPAIFAGPRLASTVRTIAYLYDETPIQATCARILSSDYLKDGGASPMKQVSYSVSISQYQSETTALVERMQASGVTTVVMSADPVTPIFFMNAAAQAGYFPEWVLIPFYGVGSINSDGWTSGFPQDESAHALTLGMVSKPVVDQEAFTAFEMGCRLPPVSDCSSVLPPGPLAFAYASTLLLFSGFQQAGPWLTPANFAAGISHLRSGLPSGMFGPWAFGPGTYDPLAGFQVLRWSPNSLSPIDQAIPGTSVTAVHGDLGTYVACNNGQLYSYASPVLPKGQLLAAQLSAHAPATFHDHDSAVVFADGNHSV